MGFGHDDSHQTGDDPGDEQSAASDENWKIVRASEHVS